VESRNDILVFDAGYLTLYIKESEETQIPVISFTIEILAKARQH
jgi:hypothetical protein